MGENFHFGGGASQTTIHPAVLVFLLLAVLGVLVLPKRSSLSLVLVGTFLIPFGQQILVGGFHLFPTRALLVSSFLRVVIGTYRVEGNWVSRSLTLIERTFVLWVVCRSVAFVLLWQNEGAVVAQCAFWLDAYGALVAFRHFIQDESDMRFTVRLLAVIAMVIAVCMLYEHLTGINLFSYINRGALVPWVRDGRVRAQGAFANSITAGTFGATLLPLFFWLWKSQRAALFGMTAMAASTAIVITSVASTPLTAYLGAILALCLWPMRAQMRLVRYGIVCVVLSLALVMKAPVWYLLARIDFVGGHGWDRAHLVDQFIRHLSDWWLIGSSTNANWGYDTWDACNQFVAEGLAGGLVGLILFLLILTQGFSMIGKSRAKWAGNCQQEWFFWCLGAGLFAHIVAFCGIDYFDHIRVLWFLFLAIIAAGARPHSMSEVVGPAEATFWFRGSDPSLEVVPGDRTRLGYNTSVRSL